MTFSLFIFLVSAFWEAVFSSFNKVLCDETEWNSNPGITYQLYNASKCLDLSKTDSSTLRWESRWSPAQGCLRVLSTWQVFSSPLRVTEYPGPVTHDLNIRSGHGNISVASNGSLLHDFCFLTSCYFLISCRFFSPSANCQIICSNLYSLHLLSFMMCK